MTKEADAAKADAKAGEATKQPVINAGADAAEQTDPVAESKETGTATTDDGRTVALSPGAVPENAKDVSDEADPHMERELTAEECKELFGELTAGEMGYLPLDANGYIIGAAKRGEPKPGEFFARVGIHPNMPDGTLRMVTPSGAAVTRKMNPEQKRDADHNKHFEEAQKALKDEGDGEDDGS